MAQKPNRYEQMSAVWTPPLTAPPLVTLSGLWLPTLTVMVLTGDVVGGRMVVVPAKADPPPQVPELLVETPLVWGIVRMITPITSSTSVSTS
ncbi:MAG: hypothetical protein CL910_09610 [Deltaproteobacteria bacterium]|nr:hypothetical protein [Deltaproteobacteria bacterium]